VNNNTIAAVSTAYGEGGIGIVRISGDRAEEILRKLFHPKAGKADSEHLSDRKMSYGHIKDPSSSETVDEVLAVLMKAPHTYTGEDVAEIQCHGSMVSLGKILALTLVCGAVSAEAGEFTKRAFLNGRIDLAQADAVIDLIRARTETGFQSALGQLQGRLSREIGGLRDRLTDVLAIATVNLDYPDEAEELPDGEAPAANRRIASLLGALSGDVKALADTAETGMLIRDGVHVVITGKPNVGKSSLMNALLKESRAIVTEIPGTTRDSIEAWLNLNGIPVRLTDTAGIREAENPVEALGVKRTKEVASRADLNLLILDGGAALDEDDKILLREPIGRLAAVVLNKADLPRVLDEAAVREMLPEVPVIAVSALRGDGMGQLEDWISESVYGGRVRQGDNLLITNLLHRDLLWKAAAEMDHAADMLFAGEALEFAEVNMREAYELLGEITGETATDEILDRVFARFCVGK
jgi:tRNA modification GTPase